MLSPSIMGALALAIFWVNVLLIAAVACKRIGALLADRARLTHVARGRVERGKGPSGALAVQRIDQVGRATDGAPAIVFHDRVSASELFGGRVALDGGGTIDLGAGPAELWIDAGAIARAAACEDDRAFDRAYPNARKAEGFLRTVAAPIGEGAEVFVARRSEGVLIATMDPRALLAKKAALAIAFVGGAIGGAAACTAIAIHPPVFGRVSTVGGALSLAFFLLVQPAGTALRDALLVPSRAMVRGRWSKRAGTGARVGSAV